MSNCISEYRKKAGLTQGELAGRLGWLQSRIGNYETGYREPGIAEAREIVSVLNDAGCDCGIDDVFPPVADQAA